MSSKMKVIDVKHESLRYWELLLAKKILILWNK